MKSPVVALLSAILGAFLGGIATYQFLADRIETQVKPVREIAEAAHARIDGLALGYSDAPVNGPTFGAGDTDKQDWVGQGFFMVGQRDGTGAQTADAYCYNVYRKIDLKIPRR
jgi:hypothetical protein